MKIWRTLPRDQDAGWMAAAILAGLALLVFQPWLWGRVYDSAATLRDRQTQREQLANVKALIEDIRTVDSTKQALLDQAAVVFPVQSAVSQVVEALESLAQAEGLTLQLTAITEPEKGVRQAGPKLLPFEVNLTALGSPQALLTFLEAVEHMPEFTAVQAWEMKPAASVVGGARVYTLSATVRLFLQPAL